jgi:hypothetical protein
MRIRQLFFLVLAFHIYGACTPEKPDPREKEYQTRLWRKSLINSIQDTNSDCSDYYLYDSRNRITKIWTCLQVLTDSAESSVYCRYKYNENDHIEAKIVYHEISKDKWEIHDSTFFLYENNMLVKEENYFFPILEGIPAVFIYEYENNLLVRKSCFVSQFEYMIRYEYQDTLCKKETRYTDPEGTVMNKYTYHFYLNGKRIRSELYSAKYNKIIQVINYTYNNYGQLILEESIVDPDFQIPYPYIYRYEYEKVPK